MTMTRKMLTATTAGGGAGRGGGGSGDLRPPTSLSYDLPAMQGTMPSTGQAQPGLLTAASVYTRAWYTPWARPRNPPGSENRDERDRPRGTGFRVQNWTRLTGSKRKKKSASAPRTVAWRTRGSLVIPVRRVQFWARKPVPGEPGVAAPPPATPRGHS